MHRRSWFAGMSLRGRGREWLAGVGAVVAAAVVAALLWLAVPAGHSLSTKAPVTSGDGDWWPSQAPPPLANGAGATTGATGDASSAVTAKPAHAQVLAASLTTTPVWMRAAIAGGPTGSGATPALADGSPPPPLLVPIITPPGVPPRPSSGPSLGPTSPSARPPVVAPPAFTPPVFTPPAFTPPAYTPPPLPPPVDTPPAPPPYTPPPFTPPPPYTPPAYTPPPPPPPVDTPPAPPPYTPPPFTPPFTPLPPPPPVDTPPAVESPPAPPVESPPPPVVSPSESSSPAPLPTLPGILGQAVG